MRVYRAKRRLRGKTRIYEPGDCIILAPEKAEPFVNKGLIEDVSEELRKRLELFGGIVYVESKVLSKTVAFCLKERVAEAKNGIQTYTEEELALILARRPTPEELKYVQMIKETMGGELISL